MKSEVFKYLFLSCNIKKTGLKKMKRKEKKYPNPHKTNDNRWQAQILFWVFVERRRIFANLIVALKKISSKNKFATENFAQEFPAIILAPVAEFRLNFLFEFRPNLTFIFFFFRFSFFFPFSFFFFRFRFSFRFSFQNEVRFWFFFQPWIASKMQKILDFGQKNLKVPQTLQNWEKKFQDDAVMHS